jgi:hypothetical protein
MCGTVESNELFKYIFPYIYLYIYIYHPNYGSAEAETRWRLII